MKGRSESFLYKENHIQSSLLRVKSIQELRQSSDGQQEKKYAPLEANLLL